MRPEVTPLFHAPTGTYTHLVTVAGSRSAVVIDPVLDFDLAAGRVGTAFADALLALVAERELAVPWVLETHAHADHLSAGDYLRQRLGARLGIGAGIGAVQRHFSAVYGLAPDATPSPAVFDAGFSDGERIALEGFEIEVLGTPGHTSDSISYRIGDAVFIGDTLFAPDVGSARCDFPGADPAALWGSIQRLLALPGDTRLYLAHDYPPEGRAPRALMTVDEVRRAHPHVVGRDEAAFVALRRARDATLPVPQLLHPALQVNIRAGRLPEPEADGRRYLRLPLTGP